MSNRKTNNSSSPWGYLLAAGIGAAVSYFASTLINEQEERDSRMRHSNRGNNSTRKFPCTPPDICVICQESISPSMVQLPCFHMFHRNCFLKWSEHCQKPQLDCPVCNATLPSDFSF